MSEVTVSAARAHLSDVVEEARILRRPVYLTRHGHRVAAVVDATELDHLLEAAEDLEDLLAARAARDEEGASVPWEQVKADLGLE